MTQPDIENTPRRETTTQETPINYLDLRQADVLNQARLQPPRLSTCDRGIMEQTLKLSATETNVQRIHNLAMKLGEITFQKRFKIFLEI